MSDLHGVGSPMWRGRAVVARVALILSWIVVLAMSSAGFLGGNLFAGATAPETRDPTLWPFASDSPWNTPLRTDATYSPITGNWDLNSVDIYFNHDQHTVAIWKASSSDPLRTVTVRDYAKLVTDPAAPEFCRSLDVPTTVQVRVPDDATPAPPRIDPTSTTYWPDATMSIIDAGGRYVWEFYQARKAADGINWRATGIMKNDLRLDGWSAFKCHHGTRASGSSQIGGIVRAGELVNGINHAIAIAITARQFNRNAPGGKSWVWPAAASDDPTTYGSVGNVYMGSLLAIPAAVDLGALPFQTVQGRNVARAIQLYGLYVTDGGGGVGTKVIIGIDYNARAEVPSQGSYANPSAFIRDLRLAAKYLRIVSNNRPNSVGGGGTPLAPLAPRLGP